MTQSDFTFWLQGYVEICGARPDETQWLIIKDHLKEVFDKRTPDRPFFLPSAGSLPFQIETDEQGNVLPVQTQFITC